jgi:hypothetical protein
MKFKVGDRILWKVQGMNEYGIISSVYSNRFTVEWCFIENDESIYTREYANSAFDRHFKFYEAYYRGLKLKELLQ